jgi:hypothetical protein
MWLLAVLLSKQNHDRVWTGTDGPFVGDQLQYLAWIREASRHVLIANPFTVEPTRATFLHPGLAISGIFTRLGMSPSLAYLLWKPIAVVAMFVAARRYINRLIVAKVERRAALVIALFYLSPIVVLASALHWMQRISIEALAIESWAGLYLWGYPFTALAVAALPATLLAYERDRGADRVRAWSPLIAFTCAWLQPWQGATVVVIVSLSEAVMWSQKRTTRLAIPAITIASAVIPLGYYSLLSHFDSSWKIAGQANQIPLRPTWTLLITLAPLGLPALLAYGSWRSATNFQEVAVLVWPIAALAVYFAIGIAQVGTFATHALQGLSIPLAVLAIRGLRTLVTRLSSAASVVAFVLFVVLATAPGLTHELNTATTTGRATVFGQAPFFFRRGEQQALDYVRTKPASAAVLAPVFLGETVPAETGHRTWVGILSWTPAYTHRVALAEQFFSGKMKSVAALGFVLSTGATILVSDCRHRMDLTAELRPLLLRVRHFDCATVYVVR